MKTPLLILALGVFAFGCSSSDSQHNSGESSVGADPFAQDIPQPISPEMEAGAEIAPFLKVQSASSPSLSPDGKWVAYRTRKTGVFQVWVTSVDGTGEHVQLTDGNSVTSHRWLPDGSGILYATDKEGNEKNGYYIISPDGSEEKELLAPSDAFRFFGDFNQAGTQFVYSTTERNGVDFDIHVYDMPSQTDTKIYEGKLGYYPVSFSPDGAYIVISESVGEDANHLFLLRLADATLTQISPADDMSEYNNIRWLPDSKSFYVVTNWDREYTGVARYEVEANRFEYLISEEYDLEQLRLGENNTLHAVANQAGYSVHQVWNLGLGRALAVNAWPQGTMSLTSNPAGTQFVAYVNSPKISGDLWAWSPGDAEAVRITESDNAGIDLSTMVLPEAHQFEARDGLTIHGLLYAPESMDAGTPVVVKVHGGPTSQARPRFDALTQYLVKKGFAIFALN
ncbi:MAG TPA: peptidase S9, partial [Cytophagales bacterium]|nr:peptidase S9 [Cytophagales bacterium]